MMDNLSIKALKIAETCHLGNLIRCFDIGFKEKLKIHVIISVVVTIFAEFITGYICFTQVYKGGILLVFGLMTLACLLGSIFAFIPCLLVLNTRVFVYNNGVLYFYRYEIKIMLKQQIVSVEYSERADRLRIVTDNGVVITNPNIVNVDLLKKDIEDLIMAEDR